MSPSTVDSTSVRLTPRAAAMLAMPAVRQAASACSRYSTGVGPLSVPTSTAGWSASKRERLLVRHLLHGAVEAVDRRLVVGAADPAVGGPELELGDLGCRP